MIDHLVHDIVLNGIIEVDGVPVPLIGVISRTNRRIASTQLQREVWVAFERNAARVALERNQREHPPADLEHRNAIAEREFLDRSRPADTEFQYFLARHDWLPPIRSYRHVLSVAPD